MLHSQVALRRFSRYIGCLSKSHALAIENPLPKNESNKNIGMLEPLPINKRVRFIVDSADEAVETDETTEAVETDEITETV